MKKMYITIGLPASGKTTWMSKHIQEHPEFNNVTGPQIICRDDIRKELFAPAEPWDWSKYKFTKAREKRVTERTVAKYAFCVEYGCDVYITDTNLNPVHRQAWFERADADGFEICIKDFTDVPIHKILQRDERRGGQAVGRDVILRMFDQYICDEKPAYDPDLPNAIIVDVDGTVAKMDGRSPFDWDKVGEDLPVHDIINLVNHTKAVGHRKVIICTGRDGCALEATKQWLSDHGVSYDHIYIRPEGDNRCDVEIKREIYLEHIQGKYNVDFVLDDRERVVLGCWRQLGLTCLQVANGVF